MSCKMLAAGHRCQGSLRLPEQNSASIPQITVPSAPLSENERIKRMPDYEPCGVEKFKSSCPDPVPPNVFLKLNSRTLGRCHASFSVELEEIEGMADSARTAAADDALEGGGVLMAILPDDVKPVKNAALAVKPNEENVPGPFVWTQALHQSAPSGEVTRMRGE